MSYIGRGTDKISNIEKLDTITFDGSSSYTLQKNSVNFTPNSANSLQVSIDGVVQAGNFTVSGSTIDFGVAIPATSTNDFIFHYGTGLVTTVADGAITTAKLGDASVTSAKLSGVTQGITEADQWRLTTNQNLASGAEITANWERVDTDGFEKIGTGMTENSGVFSFPSTGLWLIKILGFVMYDNVNVDYAGIEINVTTDNSTYNSASGAFGGNLAGNIDHSGIACEHFFNVTNTSTHKVKFTVNTNAASVRIRGETQSTYNGFSFIRLGDSV